MSGSGRRLDPPLVIPKVRRVRASDTTHNLRARAQVVALLALVGTRKGDRS